MFVFRTDKATAARSIDEEYNHLVARGWESKSVEEQQAESASNRQARRPARSPDQLAREKREKELTLSRAHILEQLGRAHNPRHLKVLRDALNDLEAKLAALN